MGELIYDHLLYLLPELLGNANQLFNAFKDPIFLRVFVRFVDQLINDEFYRLRYPPHSQLPLKLE